MVYHCKFGEFGVLEGQFTEPSGVAVNAQNDIVVADTNNHRYGWRKVFSKVEFSSELALRIEFKLFPANIWIFKLFFLIVFTIKMLLDKAYGLLNLLEFKFHHFSTLF